MATIVSGSKDQALQAALQSMLPPGMPLPDEEALEFSFATVYNGPRPPYVPKAEVISIRPFSVPGVVGSYRSSSSHPTQVAVDTHQSVLGALLENSSRENPEGFPTDTSNSVTSTGYIVSEESSNPSQNQVSPEAQDADADSPSSPRGISVEDMFASFRLETGEVLPYPGQEDHISIRSDFRFSGRKSSSFHASNSSANGFSGELQDQTMLGPNSSNNEQRRKGECHECLKGHRLQEKESCLVCNAKYCISCVVKAMGSMPEGRKCVKCIGQPIDESRRPNLGKPSRLLSHLLDTLEVQQIMKAERECLANQLRPEQIYVNGKHLNSKELAELLGCSNPPSRLKPGKYWYDGECGYWGKEGEKPEKIITASLHVGGNLDEKASAGCTEVYINGREITKIELRMLKFAGVQCLPKTRLWVQPDGTYQEEGQNNHPGNIWRKATSRFLYPLFSLPIPSFNTVASEPSRSLPAYLDQKKNYKILLLGHAGCGTSTIFKQAKILYEEHDFTSKELQNIKLMIQRNIYKYITILLEARERFEDEENTTKLSLGETTPSTLAPSESGDAGQVQSDRKNPYTINARLKDKADLFLDIIANGQPDAYFPAASWEYALLVEEMWKDPAIQATYKRRDELHILPDVAEDFLDRVVDISSNDYTPSHRDILHAEGLIHGSGLAEIEFCLPENSATSGAYTENFNQPFTEVRYHLIRINGDGMADGCKWLEMFEYVHAVIFCVALDAYDQMWSDGKAPLQNKMLLSRELFESILKYPYFQNKPVVLLLNKYDSFEEKVHTVPLTKCEWFSDFDPVRSSHTTQSLAPQAYTYIAHKFKKHFEMINPTGRKLFTFQLKAWEQSCVDAAFQYVKETLKWEEIQTASLPNMPWDSRSYSTEMSSISPFRAN